VAYRQATPTVRRLLNQALFEGLLIRDEDDLETNPTPWAAEVRRLARASQGRPTAARTREDGRSSHGPRTGAVGFHKANLVRLVEQLSNPSAALAAVFEAAAVVRQGPRELRESVVMEPASRI
jgi:hypothetical protein